MKNIIIQAREADSNSNRNGDYTSILKTPITINAGDEVVVNNTFIDTRNITTDRIVIEEDLPVSMTANIYVHDNELFNRRRYTSELLSTNTILSAEKRWLGGWSNFTQNPGEAPPPAPLLRFQFITSLEIPILPGFTEIKEMNIQLRYFSFGDKITDAEDPFGRRYEYVPHYVVLKVPATTLGENVNPEDRSIFLYLDDKISGNVNWRDKSLPIVNANVGLIVRVKGDDDVEFARPFVGIESERERYMKNGLDIDNILPLGNVDWNVGAPQVPGGDYAQTLIGGFSLLEPNFEFIIPKKSYSPTELADFISLQINAVARGEFSFTSQIEDNAENEGGIAPNTQTYVSNNGRIKQYDDNRWNGGPFFTNENLLNQNKENHKLPTTDFTTLPSGPLNGEVGFAGDGEGFKFSKPQVPTNYANHSVHVPIPQGGESDGVPNMEDFTSSRMIGASQIALEYNDGFKWTFLHTPIYSAGDIVVSYNNAMSWFIDNVPLPGQPNQDYVAGVPGGYWLGAYSGISWTSLTPASLWEDTLGFDLHSLCFSPRYENTDASREVLRTPPAATGGGAFSKFFVNYLAFKDIPLTQKHLWTIPISTKQLGPVNRGYIKNGTNATSGEISNSALLNKYNPSAITGSDPIITFTYPDPGGGTPIGPVTRTSTAPIPNVVVGISDATIPCLADVSVLDGSLNSGYFLLEINGKMINEFTGNSFNSNLIMGVLSRYYSLGNYTSGDTAGLSYIHKGEPILITELGIRILQPNGELAQVGNDNAIFIKVIKPPPPPPVIAPPKNEKKK